jgi:glyoxylase-like metal-dependent hydrolase (beta-lactamase superfamily II)
MENTYLVWDSTTKNAIVIDPGCSNSSEEESLAGFIRNENLNLLFLLNTHCHIDHIFGNAFVKN